MQPLGLAIDAERTERVQAITDCQNQISELREEFHAFASNSSQGDARIDARNEEIVIGGVGLKSKDGAIKIVEKVIVGNDGNPTIVKNPVSMVPKIIILKFDSRIHSESFVRSYAGKHSVFPYKYYSF